MCCVCARLQPFLARSVTCVRLIASLLLVCVSKRGWPFNNDITSASVNHSPPPTEQEVARARRRKQERQGWRRSVFAPAGWWACEQGNREDKKRTRKKSCCCRCRCWWWWAYVKQSRKGWKGRRYQRMEIRGDFLWSVFPRRDPCVFLICYSLFFICFFETVFIREKLQIQAHTRWASSIQCLCISAQALSRSAKFKIIAVNLSKLFSTALCFISQHSGIS